MRSALETYAPAVPPPAAEAPPVTNATLPWKSLVELVSHRAEVQPHALALGWIPQLTEVTRRVTCADLDRRARAVASRLQALGAKGERALLVLDNDPDYIIAFLGCAYAGCVAVTLHTPTQKKHLQRLAHVARDAEARFLVSTRPIADRFRAPIEASEGMPGTTWLLVDEVPDDAAETYEPHYPAASDLAYLQYTSGSTGVPRGVMIDHANLVYQGEVLERLCSFHPQDRALTWLPLFHDMGLILGVVAPLYTGFPVLLTSPGAFIKAPDKWLRAISTHRITYTGGPDFCFDLCVETVDPATLESVDLSSWAVALNAAEPVRARTIDRFMEKFGPLGFRAEAMSPGYGLAEATLGVAGKIRGTLPVRRFVDVDALAEDRVVLPASPERARELVASGRMVPDTVVKIVDQVRGVALGVDRVGEIWVGGSGPAKGYWRQPEASEATFAARLPDDPQVYMRTGDLGFVDARGNIFITGRTKDLIIVAGKNHYPSDLEQTVEAASPVLRAHFSAAFQVERDEKALLVVVAEVKRECEAGLDVNAVGREVMRKVLAQHEIAVDEVVLLQVGQVPKTTSGKVQRRQCKQQWLEGSFLVHGSVKR